MQSAEKTRGEALKIAAMLGRADALVRYNMPYQNASRHAWYQEALVKFRDREFPHAPSACKRCVYYTWDYHRLRDDCDACNGAVFEGGVCDDFFHDMHQE